ncbi:MAG: insulinase family protein [Bacteroidales bacterium]|nr:insulinase family protein [Bacteroidales bacterium]MBR2856543.1 insulinase family protein [Bacteroidales bacterium]
MITGKTDCGLQYAVRKRISSVAYCALSIKCGTRDEEGYHGGIAHFVEHTIFKGTSRRSATVINGYLDRLGGELNAFTTKEEIVLHATVLKEDLGKAASLLFELATEATFPEHEIQTEKGVVIDEIRSYKDSPSEDIYDKFEEMLFEGHPLSGNILGTAASVRKISPEELRRFVKEKFLPHRMAFTVVADIEEARMEKEVRKIVDGVFGKSGETELSQNKDRLSTKGPTASDVPAHRRFDITLNKRNHQANCTIGGLAPSLYQERDRLATVLMCNILGGPANNSRLNSVLREKNGWVYGVECGYTQYADTGIVTISLGCDKANVDRCLRAIRKELDKLQNETMSDRKLKAARKQLLGQLAISGDNGETQCLSMGKSLLAFGKIAGSEENKEMVEGITAEDIRRMAREIFAPERLSQLIYI